MIPFEVVVGDVGSDGRYLEKLEKNKRQRARIMSLMHEETIPESEARKTLLKIKESDNSIQAKLANIGSPLDGTITSAMRREVAERVAESSRESPRLVVGRSSRRRWTTLPGTIVDPSPRVCLVGHYPTSAAWVSTSLETRTLLRKSTTLPPVGGSRGGTP